MKHIAIIGGGVSGMAAAIAAAERRSVRPDHHTGTQIPAGEEDPCDRQRALQPG